MLKDTLKYYLSILLLSTTILFAGVPEKISYEGYYEYFGTPYTGTIDVVFEVKNLSSIVVWIQTNIGVQCLEGIYSVQLNVAPYSVIVPDDTYQLSTTVIKVGVVPENINNVNDILANPYSYYAKQVEWAESTNGNTIIPEGNVGIGMTPLDKLSVNGNVGITGNLSVGTVTSGTWNGAALTAAYVPNHDDLNGFAAGEHFTMASITTVGTVTAGNVSAIETDPKVGANTANYLPKWNGTSLVAGSIFDNGNIGIGTLSPRGKLDVHGEIFYYGAHIHSDRRLKRDIKPLENALDKVTQLQGVSYKWNEKTKLPEELTGKKQIGLIAQEVEQILPDIVSKDDSGYLSVSYDKLIPLLIEGIKELKKENEEIKNRDEQILAENKEIKLQLQSILSQLRK